MDGVLEWQRKRMAFRDALREVLSYAEKLISNEPLSAEADMSSKRELEQLLSIMKENAQNEHQKKLVEGFARMLVPDQAQKF